MVNNHESERTSTYFLTFDTLENSTSALETLQDMGTCRVKYAHYRIFFKN